MEIEDIKLQNSLGRIEPYYRNDMKMNGMMGVARVLKVHHKSGSADVVLVNTKDTYVSTEKNEGKFSARILQRSSVFDKDRERYWGSIDPIAEGSLVLIAFLEGMKYRPIILGCFPRPDNINNSYQNIYPLKEKESGYNRREALKQLRISPSLSYRKEDGEGNIELSFANRSFFAMYNTALDTQGNLFDNHNGFDHHDLSEVDKRTNETISTDWEESKQPSRILFVHRSNYDKPTTWTKVFFSEQGLFRISRDNNDDKLTYIELNNSGSFIIRRQLDDPDHGEGVDFSEIKILENGNISLVKKDLNNETTFVISNTGIDINTNGIVNINATTINLNEG